MKNEIPSFDKKNPQTKQHKLIIELTNNLIDTMKVFIGLNKLTTESHDLFLIMRDGALAYAAQTMEVLVSMLADKSEIPKFIQEARNILDAYFKHLEEKCGR
jgi:hypothetical protein